jgi:hypothetical protein
MKVKKQSTSELANELLITLEWEADKKNIPLLQRDKDQLLAVLVRVLARKTK